MPPVMTANTPDNAMIRPVRSGSVYRNWATYLVAVIPRLNPANTANIVTVERIMPYSPYTSRPNILATNMDARSISPREINAPVSDQNAPLTRREPIEEERIRLIYTLRFRGKNLNLFSFRIASYSIFLFYSTLCLAESQALGWDAIFYLLAQRSSPGQGTAFWHYRQRPLVSISTFSLRSSRSIPWNSSWSTSTSRMSASFNTSANS